MTNDDATNQGQLHYSFTSGDLPLGHVVVEHAAERAAVKSPEREQRMNHGTNKKSRDLYQGRYEQFVKLHEANTPFEEMAEKIGVSEATLRGDRYLKKYEK
jgi:hypothetical protein